MSEATPGSDADKPQKRFCAAFARSWAVCRGNAPDAAGGLPGPIFAPKSNSCAAAPRSWAAGRSGSIRERSACSYAGRDTDPRRSGDVGGRQGQPNHNTCSDLLRLQSLCGEADGRLMPGRLLCDPGVVVRRQEFQEQGLRDPVHLSDEEGPQQAAVDPAQNRTPLVAGQIADLLDAQHLGIGTQSDCVIRCDGVHRHLGQRANGPDHLVLQLGGVPVLGRSVLLRVLLPQDQIGLHVLLPDLVTSAFSARPHAGHEAALEQVFRVPFADFTDLAKQVFADTGRFDF